ncbi:MAG: hypothetical protein U1A78_32160 [Polyangia bacterium]
MFDQIKSLEQSYQDCLCKFRAEGLDALKVALREFFTRFPAVRAIRWQQYTPYFNDGDACTFSVHTPRVRLDDESTEGDYEDGFLTSWCLRHRDTELQKAFSELSDLLQSDALEAVLEAVFGDHVEVTATPDKLEAEGYDHS